MEKLNSSSEPMDVDLSVHSVSAMDISYNEAEEVVFVKSEFKSVSPKIERTVPEPRNSIKEQRPIKIYHINKQTVTNKSCSKFSILLTFFLTLFVSIITYHILNFECSADLDVNHVKNILTKKLYGQPMAIDLIVDVLSREDHSKILFFSGGTGVGKTYAASLILENVWGLSNIYHYTMPSFTNIFSTELLLGMTMCKTSTFIIDGLSRDDMHIKTYVEDLITKSESIKKNITIILIFNCDNITKGFSKRCEESFYTELLDVFSDVKALKQVIKFGPLQENHLKQCIENELIKNNVKTDNMDELLRNFDVSLDGCKGVYTKIKYLINA